MMLRLHIRLRGGTVRAAEFQFGLAQGIRDAHTRAPRLCGSHTHAYQRTINAPTSPDRPTKFLTFEMT